MDMVDSVEMTELTNRLAEKQTLPAACVSEDMKVTTIS